MLRDGPLDIAMTDVPDGFPVHRTMSETAGGFAFTEMSIVDDDGEPVSDGTVGELLIRGIGVMAGYNKRERWETFDDDGWYHTGDRVYRKEGDPRLFYVGRTSELIKAAGANVSPLEVEAVIEQFADVAQCVVVGIDDPVRGEEVCAVVVPADAEIDMESVAARTRDQLSAYKVPTRWVLATSDQIPTLPSGKLNRRGLRELVVDGTLEAVRQPGESVGPGDVGDRTRVVVGVGQRPVVALQASHREAARGEALFAGDADRPPRHAGDTRLRHIAHLVKRAAVGDERVAPCRRRFEHGDLDATGQPLHFVDDGVHPHLGLARGCRAGTGRRRCRRYPAGRSRLRIGTPCRSHSVARQPKLWSTSSSSRARTPRRVEILDQGRGGAGDVTVGVLDHHDDGLDRCDRGRQHEPEVVAVAHDQSAEHAGRRTP